MEDFFLKKKIKMTQTTTHESPHSVEKFSGWLTAHEKQADSPKGEEESPARLVFVWVLVLKCVIAATILDVAQTEVERHQYKTVVS